MASVQDLVKQILLAAHPVGSYYWSSEATDPGTLFGGTWEQIKDRFLYAVGDGSAAGDTGGASSHAITVAEMPSHTHTRGTMEITGKVTYITADSGNISSTDYPTTGAFRWLNEGFKNRATTTTGTGSRDLDFAASRSWTGSTSSTGGGSAMSIMPPYITAFCWRRTA